MDVRLHVFVETFNADDPAALASAADPTVVLNKADLTGFRGDGPMVAAARRCRELERVHAVPTRPFSALLAVAGTDPAVLDAAMLDGLRRLSTPAAEVPGPSGAGWPQNSICSAPHARCRPLRSDAGCDGVAHLLRSVSGLRSCARRSTRAAALLRYSRLAVGPAADDEPS